MLSQSQPPSVCPKTGKPIRVSHPPGWNKWLFPITGLAALGWFLVRVIPKPSRAAYPCQRVAMPLASGFVVWLLGVLGSVAIFRKARQNWQQSRYKVAGVCLVVGLIITAALPLSTLSGSAEAASHTDPANSPMGVAQGINPGRVSWVYDPAAAVWNGTTGNWWDENSTNQASVDSMLSKAIQSLTGTTSDTAAWDALFRSFNQKRGKGNVGYVAGEQIVIKLNMNEGRGSYAANNKINASPQMVLALSRQLVNNAGVSQSSITFYDASRYMIDDIYNKVKPEFPNINFMDAYGQYGRIKVQWAPNVVRWSVSNTNGSGLPTMVVDAEYMISMALMKLHSMAGMTLTGKNHIGTISSISHAYFGPSQAPSYSTFTDLMAHKDLGQKTFLFMIDSLYAQDGPDGVPHIKWSVVPFNNRWPSSLFVSQDQVALDSVGYDFLNAQWPNYGLLSYADNYLHEAAQANNPPSGTFYAPNGDGVRAQSLGVHEHWNNNTDKKYTRNLGTGSGIELVYIGPNPIPPTTPPPTTPPPGGNLAQGHPVVCSSVENAGMPCANAVDGSATTRWGSAFSDPQWIYVDLGASYAINRVVLNWEAAYGRSYQIQVSDNASSWATIYSTTTSDGGIDDLAVSGAGRYVRMNGTVRATAYGYSLWEYQIYGGGTPPPTTPPPTTPPPTTPPPTTPPPTTPPPTTPPPTTPPPGQAPYGGTPWPIPGTVQAENYDTGSEGVAYHDTTTGNSGSAYRTDGVDIQATTDTGGGNNIGWTAGGEWLEYTVNVATSGTYSLNVRAAAPAAGSSVHMEIDGVNVTGAVAIPSTGGWQTWTTVTRTGLSLSAGQHVLRIAIDMAGLNLNWVSLTSGGTPPPTTPPPTTPPPTTPPPTTNLALGRPATSSANEGAFTPNLAVDGSTGTRWSSGFTDSQWISVDLGSARTINRVVLRWEAAYGRGYQIQVSSDGASWATIYTTSTSDGGVDDLSGLSGSGRYVRMLGTLRATQYGYSLWEVEIYGN